MYWNSIVEGKKTYLLTHLHPYTFKILISGVFVTIKVFYGFHVFTDDKGNGKEIHFRNETRYFCQERYELSRQLPLIIEQQLTEGYVVAFRTKKRREQFFYLDLHDYAIFMDLRKSESEENTVKLTIVSAYEVSTWGRPMLPRGKAYKWKNIIFHKLNGKKLV